jgi:hypothetical protein
MKPRLGAQSLLLFVLSCAFLLLLTLLESWLASLSPTGERVISVLLLIVPGSIGVAVGVRSLRRQELPRRVATLGVLLNGLFVLFHIFVLALAG